MKTKTILTIFSLLIFTVVFNGCSDDDGDTTKPVITLNAPGEGATFEPGTGIHLDMDFEDNENLGSYKVEIHNNIEDPHDHKSTKAVNNEKSNYFSFNRSWDISGSKTKHIDLDIDIPRDVEEGAYHLIIYCFDAVGNDTHLARSILIGHGEEH